MFVTHCNLYCLYHQKFLENYKLDQDKIRFQNSLVYFGTMFQIGLFTTYINYPEA